MKYAITINQVGVVRAGLLGITDFSDWAIMSYIKDLFAHPKSKRIPIDDKLFVWINYKHIMEEMPMLLISTKDPLTDRFKKLKKLHLIETFILKDNTTYVRLTERCMEVFSYKETIIKESPITPPIGPNSDSLSAQTLTGGIGPNSDSTSSISNQVEYQSNKTSCVSENSPENAVKVNNKKTANPEITQFIGHAFSAHQNKFNEKLHITGGKDGDIIKNLFKTYTLTELKQYWDTYIDMDDRYFASQGYTIALFSHSLNKVIAWHGQRQKADRMVYKPSYHLELN